MTERAAPSRLLSTYNITRKSEERVMSDMREALQAMLRLFDDQGNMVADFNTLQAAVNCGYAALSQPEAVEADWRDDERWSAGLDFAMIQLCAVMDVDPHDVTWDAATEEVEGDVRAVIWNILRAKMGEDWKPEAPPLAPDERMRRALEFYADPFAWKKKHDPENTVFVPDHYDVSGFGDSAKEALSRADDASNARTEARLRALYDCSAILAQPSPQGLRPEEKMIWILGDLMNAAENYFGVENPKRLGHIHCAAKRLYDEVLDPLALSAGGDEAKKSEGDCGAKRCRDLKTKPEPLRNPGVGRDAENERSLCFYFSRRATDHEMRLLHDVMQRACACMSTLETKDKEIEALKHQNDYEKQRIKELEEERYSLADKSDAAEARAETAERERDDARAALKPFADVVERDISDNEMDDDYFHPRLRIGHLRAARAITGED